MVEGTRSHAQPSLIALQVLSVPNPNIPGTVGMFPVEVQTICDAIACAYCTRLAMSQS